jgi:hypothetical protein
MTSTSSSQAAAASALLRSSGIAGPERDAFEMLRHVT